MPNLKVGLFSACLVVGSAFGASVTRPSCNKIGSAVASSRQCWWGESIINLPSGMSHHDLGADTCCYQHCSAYGGNWCSDKSGCAITTTSVEYMRSTSVSNGYCRYTKSCTCGSCTNSISSCTYSITHCADGYYKSGNSCVRCPYDSGAGTYGTGGSYNSGGITSCCVASGVTGSDSTGSFVYTNRCCYTN